MSGRYEIRPGAKRPGQARYATHGEVLLALQKTAKQLGLVAKLPAGKRGDRWRASFDGLIVIGDTKRIDDRSLEQFHVEGPCDQTKLLAFAGQIAAIAGTQAVIGEDESEFWFVDKSKPAKSTKRR